MHKRRPAGGRRFVKSKLLLSSQFPARHLSLIEYRIRSHVCWLGGQHLFFAIDQSTGVERGNLKTMPVRDGIGGASLHAVSAKYTSVVINIVDAGVALSAAHAVLSRVLGGLDVNTIRGAGGGAQETGYALLQPAFVALQHMDSAKAVLELRTLQRPRPVGIILHLRGLKHLHKGDAHALGNGRDVLQD